MGGKKDQFCEEKKKLNIDTQMEMKKTSWKYQTNGKKKFTIYDVQWKLFYVITLVETQTIYIDGMITLAELILLINAIIPILSHQLNDKNIIGHISSVVTKC